MSVRRIIPGAVVGWTVAITLIFGLGDELVSSGSALAAPPGQRIIDRVLEAYEQTDRYEAEITFYREGSEGSDDGEQNDDPEADPVSEIEAETESNTEAGSDTKPSSEASGTGDDKQTFHVALDRPANKLAIDVQEARVVIDGSVMRLSSSTQPDQYRELTVPEPVPYAAVVQAAPPIGQRLLVDAVFLLTDDPVEVLSQGVAIGASPIAPAPNDPETRPRLSIPLGYGELILTLDPQTWLITKAVAQAQAADGTTETAVYEIDIKAHNTELSEDAFAFDTSNRQLIGPPAGGGRGGATGGGGGPPTHPLVGQDAPELTLPQAVAPPGDEEPSLSTAEDDEFELKAELADQNVVVLMFWASFAPSCGPALEQAQAVQQWIDQGERSAEVVAIACGDPAEKVREIWDQSELTMRCLIDAEYQYAESFSLQTVPHTVVIADGKVRGVLTGSPPDLQEQLQQRVEELLAELPSQSGEANTEAGSDEDKSQAEAEEPA